MIALEYANHAMDVEDPALPAILRLLRERIGTDFSCYRPATVRRRITNRMICAGVESLGKYLELLQTVDDEALRLLERITIKVSRFYRNKPAWDRLRADILPRLAAEHGAVRVWSAGCGCGEEPYTLAMLMEDAGIDGSIVASDLDPAALETALAGRYADGALEELPEELRARFLLPSDAGRYSVAGSLRWRVRHVRHDLTAAQAAPAGAPFDLICCRNVLIYFDRDMQAQVLDGLCDALRPGGYLFLGEAEWPMPQLAGRLSACDRPARIFRAPVQATADAAARAVERRPA